MVGKNGRENDVRPAPSYRFCERRKTANEHYRHFLHYEGIRRGLGQDSVAGPLPHWHCSPTGIRNGGPREGASGRTLSRWRHALLKNRGAVFHRPRPPRAVPAVLRPCGVAVVSGEK